MVGNIWQRGDDFVLYVAFDLVHQKRVGLQQFQSDLNSGSQAAIEARCLLRLNQEARDKEVNNGDHSHPVPDQTIDQVFLENGNLFIIHEDPIAAKCSRTISTALSCLLLAFPLYLWAAESFNDSHPPVLTTVADVDVTQASTPIIKGAREEANEPGVAIKLHFSPPFLLPTFLHRWPSGVEVSTELTAPDGSVVETSKDYFSDCQYSSNWSSGACKTEVKASLVKPGDYKLQVGWTEMSNRLLTRQIVPLVITMPPERKGKDAPGTVRP